MDDTTIKQIVNGIGAVTELLGVYKKGLVRNGFSRTESLQMCMDFVRMIFENILSMHTEDDE